MHYRCIIYCVEHTARFDHEQENVQNITSFMKSTIQYNKNIDANNSNGITLNKQFVVESIPTTINQHKWAHERNRKISISAQRTNDNKDNINLILKENAHYGVIHSISSESVFIVHYMKGFCNNIKEYICESKTRNEEKDHEDLLFPCCIPSCDEKNNRSIIE